MHKKNKTLKIIIFAFFLFQTLVMSAKAAGFIFNWQPIIVNTNLFLDNQDRQALIKNIYSADIYTSISEDFKELASLYADEANLPEQKPKKKSLSDNIKFTFYQISEFIPDRFDKLTNGDDEQLSQVVKAMTSLIYGESKIKSLETIGKIIEPQVNFYFEF